MDRRQIILPAPTPPPLAALDIISLWFVIGCKQSGFYGTKCDIPCSITCIGSTCHIQSGACFDCEHGVYGSYCNSSCPANCKNSTCHKQNGSCIECRPGLYGNYCNQSCSTNCKDKTCHMHSGACFACEPGWTGMYCNTSKNIGICFLFYHSQIVFNVLLGQPIFGKN